MGALDGKVIAVTGAGRGIGRAVALGAAAEGAAVIVNDYGVSIDGNEPTSEVADAVVEEITAAGGRAAANAQSVTTMEGGASIVQQAVDTFGRIDGVVCVAGILRERMLFNMSEEEWDPVIETHLKGTFTVFRAAAPIFRAAEERHDDRLHVGRVRGERRAGQLLGGEGRHRLARPQRGGRHEQVRRDRELHRAGREVAHVGQRAVRHRDGRTRRRRADGRASCSPTHARDITGQMYTVNGGRVAVWNQPVEVREMRNDGRWTVDELAAALRRGRPGTDADPRPRSKEMEARGEERREAEPVRHRDERPSSCTSWKGEPAVTLRAGEYEATFLPDVRDARARRCGTAARSTSRGRARSRDSAPAR